MASIRSPCMRMPIASSISPPRRTVSASIPMPPINPRDPFLRKLASVAASSPETLLQPSKNSDMPPYLDLFDTPKLMATPAQVERSVSYNEHRPRKPPPDLPSLLLHGRIVYIGMPLVPAVTELVIAELMYLQWMDPKDTIYLYINSTGTTRDDGETVGMETEGFAIYDAMMQLKNECRNVVWLPAPIISASVTSQVCTTCIPGPVYQIQFNFRRTEIPPNYDVNHLGCIGGCDDALKELTEICGTGPRIPSSTSARGLHPTDFSASTQRGGATRQTGHSSSDWPSQTPNARHSQNDRNQISGSGRAPVVCNSCGTPCILRTSNVTASRGRKFYSCQSQECNFFLWEDNVESNGTGRGTSTHRGTASRRRGRGRGRREGMSSTTTAGTFVTATGEPVSGGRCYSCGDPSHFANVCPNRGTR